MLWILYCINKSLVSNAFDWLFACPQENGDIAADDGLHRGVQYPFAVNEKVVIKVRFSILFPCILFMAVVTGIARMEEHWALCWII
jgi:hypothetical protein